MTGHVTAKRSVCSASEPARGRRQAALRRDGPRLSGKWKVGILAGGAGTRVAEEIEVRPNPMVGIGGRPILWRIMQHSARYGFKDFVIALGYKGDYIKKYFIDHCTLNSNLQVDFKSGGVERHGGDRPDWTVELIDTGAATLTQGGSSGWRPFSATERSC